MSNKLINYVGECVLKNTSSKIKEWSCDVVITTSYDHSFEFLVKKLFP